MMIDSGAPLSIMSTTHCASTVSHSTSAEERSGVVITIR
jgi:hypothetical protein